MSGTLRFSTSVINLTRVSLIRWVDGKQVWFYEGSSLIEDFDAEKDKEDFQTAMNYINTVLKCNSPTGEV